MSYNLLVENLPKLKQMTIAEETAFSECLNTAFCDLICGTLEKHLLTDLKGQGHDEMTFGQKALWRSCIQTSRSWTTFPVKA